MSSREAVVGSAEFLEVAFRDAAAAADRALGLWLAGSSVRGGMNAAPLESDRTPREVRALRALARAAATAYARRLRAEGATPERMLVLVKTATGHHPSPGFGAQELTNDIVRWSIEAYFDD